MKNGSLRARISIFNEHDVPGPQARLLLAGAVALGVDGGAQGHQEQRERGQEEAGGRKVSVHAGTTRNNVTRSRSRQIYVAKRRHSGHSSEEVSYWMEQLMRPDGRLLPSFTTEGTKLT